MKTVNLIYIIYVQTKRREAKPLYFFFGLIDSLPQGPMFIHNYLPCQLFLLLVCMVRRRCRTGHLFFVGQDICSLLDRASVFCWTGHLFFVGQGICFLLDRASVFCWTGHLFFVGQGICFLLDNMNITHHWLNHNYLLFYVLSRNKVLRRGMSHLWSTCISSGLGLQ